uniref:BRCT domain-containing protein n=1 Tax=Caulerpa okamurae TaxID=118247 RepID=A0A3S6I4K0_9CHLO|nr:hypothetical protein [Caulerpa okamurae]
MYSLNFSEERATEIIDNIDNTQSCYFKDWLIALGFKNIGPQKAKVLCEQIASFDDFINLAKSEQSLINCIGPAAANTFYREFQQNERLINLFQDFTFLFSKNDSETKPFLGLKIVLTGKLLNLTRKEAQEQIEQLGVVVQKTLSWTTDFLVVGENPSSSKIQKAQSIGCPLLKLTGKDLKDLL